MTLKDLHHKLLIWNGLKFGDKPVDPFAVFVKLVEETNEVGRALHKNDRSNGMDEIADCLVCLFRMCLYFGVTLEQCIDQKLPVLMDRVRPKSKCWSCCRLFGWG